MIHLLPIGFGVHLRHEWVSIQQFPDIRLNVNQSKAPLVFI